MLFVEKFRNNRIDYLKQSQRLHSTLDKSFSLCSNQYIEKFPKLRRLEPSNIGYPHNQTLLFLSKKSSTDMKITTENQQQIGMIQKNKSFTTNLSKGSVRDDDKQISNENIPTRWYHQVSRNVNGLTKSTINGNSFSTCFSLPMQTESDRPTTAPLVFDENMRRTISTKIKSNTPYRLLNPHVIDLSDNFDNLANSSIFQFKSIMSENDNEFVQRSYTDSNIRDSFIESSTVINSPIEIEEKLEDEPKTLHRDSQCKMNGFQHIANLGSWQRHSINQPEESPDIASHEENLDDSSERIYEYKSPFPEEYDQAISLQTQIQINYNYNYNYNNEWNLKDFYRDVKTPFESGTNTKSVFEKCLKLSRLQANTIKWEQRRRQNLNLYNRLIKTSTFDNNILSINGNFPPNITDLKRELRCNECKRVTCLGNCAPGQEYHQYKRYVPLSSLSSNPREQIRCKLALRTQRPIIDIRPRSQQIVRAEQTNTDSVVVVPLFEDESTRKRSQKKLSQGFFTGKSFRSQRQNTLTFFPSNKISS